MVKAFFIPNKQSVLGQQEILTAKSILALVDGLESHSYDAVYLEIDSIITMSISSVESWVDLSSSLKFAT